MQKLNILQPTAVLFDQPYNLSKIKRDCFDMLVRSGRGEDGAYESIAEMLQELNFADFSNEEYRAKLLEVVKEMIQLDDLQFNLDKLYSFREGLS